MRENTEENKKLFYEAGEILELLGPTTPSLSSFYRYVKSGQIRNQDQGYNGEDVRRFLKGDFSRKKGGVKRDKPSGAGIRRERPHFGKPIIDCAREISDLAHTSSMEFKRLGKASLSPKLQLSWIETQLSWMEKNNYACWFISSPGARDDVWATLGMLPMPKDVIDSLLKGEKAFQDVKSDDLLAYDSEQSPFSCYMSAVVRPDREDSLLMLLTHVFAFWCEQGPPIQIDKLYFCVEGEIQKSPFHKLVEKFYFSPLPDLSSPPKRTAWVLNFAFYNPSEEIQKVQKCFQEGKKEGVFAPLEVATAKDDDSV